MQCAFFKSQVHSKEYVNHCKLHLTIFLHQKLHFSFYTEKTHKLSSILIWKLIFPWIHKQILTYCHIAATETSGAGAAGGEVGQGGEGKEGAVRERKPVQNAREFFEQLVLNLCDETGRLYTHRFNIRTPDDHSMTNHRYRMVFWNAK